MAKIEQSWEPGTLDKTRKNLGVLSEEEAKKMMKVLGGEVLQEKSAQRAVGGAVIAEKFPQHQPCRFVGELDLSTEFIFIYFQFLHFFKS